MPDLSIAWEDKVLHVYEGLKDILREPDTPPSVRANAIQALACVWQMVNDLCLDYEMTYDYGA